MVELATPQRGEIWWAAADKRRPVVVVQTDRLNRTALGWILSVPVTSNVALADLPGNVRLSRKDTRLSKISVANVGHTAPVPRAGFRERVARLPASVMKDIDAGLRRLGWRSVARPANDLQPSPAGAGDEPTGCDRQGQQPERDGDHHQRNRS